MLLIVIGRAAALAACLMLALPAWGDEHETAPQASPETADAPEASSETSTAPDAARGVADARALIEGGRFEEALAILAPLVEGDAVEANAVFLYGLAAVGVAQQPDLPDETREALLDEAIGAFRAMLIDEPRLLRVRLELARAFYFKSEDDLARRHFELVLAAGPPEAVVANVRRFLAEMEARRRWRFRLGAALAPDSNIGSSSDERIIYVFDVPFSRNQPDLARRASASRSGAARSITIRWRRESASAQAPSSRGGSTSSPASISSSSRPISAPAG